MLQPRISIIGVPAHLPEAKDVAVQESDFADEFRAFPGVTLRDDHARGAPMFFRDRFAVPAMGDQDVVIHANIERVIGRITVVAFEKDMAGAGFWANEVGDGEE